MTARFGNLTTLQFEDKTEIDLTPEDRLWMENHRQDKVDVNHGDNVFHIFELPFVIVAGNECGKELVKRLSEGGYEFKKHFVIETLEADD